MPSLGCKFHSWSPTTVAYWLTDLPIISDNNNK